MKKTKKVIITILAVLLVIAVLLFFAYNYAMRLAADKAVKTIVKSEINSMLETGEITMDEVLQIANGEPQEAVDVSDVEDEPADKAEDEEKTPSEKTKEELAPKAPVSQEKKDAVDKAAEKVNADISDADKLEVIKLIRSRLTSADMKKLLGFLSGGLTKKEISEAAKIAYSRFSSEEIVRVKEFWHKYKNNLQRAKE